MASVRVLIADDSPAVLENVAELLQEQFVVAAAVPDGNSVVLAVTTLNPDVVVLDISLGDMTGLDVARRLREMKCPAKIVFLTVHESLDFVQAAIAVGASGYVFKSRADADLVDAVNAAFRGEKFLPVEYR